MTKCSTSLKRAAQIRANYEAKLLPYFKRQKRKNYQQRSVRLLLRVENTTLPDRLQVHRDFQGVKFNLLILNYGKQRLLLRIRYVVTLRFCHRVSVSV